MDKNKPRLGIRYGGVVARGVRSAPGPAIHMKFIKVYRLHDKPR